MTWSLLKMLILFSFVFRCMIDIIKSTMLRYDNIFIKKMSSDQKKIFSWNAQNFLTYFINKSLNFFHLVNKKSIVLCHPIHYCKYNTYALHKLCISYVMELWSKKAKNSWAKYSVIKTWLMIMYFLISFPLWDLGSGVAKFNHI